MRTLILIFYSFINVYIAVNRIISFQLIIRYLTSKIPGKQHNCIENTVFYIRYLFTKKDKSSTLNNIYLNLHLASNLLIDILVLKWSSEDKKSSLEGTS